MQAGLSETVYGNSTAISVFDSRVIDQSQEFVIGGYTAENPFDALIVGCYEDNKLKYVGKVRAGFVPHIRCAMMPPVAVQDDVINEYPISEYLCAECVDRNTSLVLFVALGGKNQ